MVESKPILIVIAGPNGSGKTTITEQILKHHWLSNCLYINPDNIAQERFGDWNSREAVIQAAEIAYKMRTACIENMQSLIFETVLSSTEKLDFINQAHRKGYFIRLFFISTDHPTINASRIARRVMEGGHDVPIPKIISRYSKSNANCFALSKIVDRLYVYDNSRDNEAAKLLFRASNGQLHKIYDDINIWAQEIYRNLVKPA